MRPRAVAGRVARRAVKLALRPSPVRRLARAELAGPKASPPIPAWVGERTFIDRYGSSHLLNPLLRDRLKPGWRAMLDPETIARAPSDEALQKRAASAMTIVRDARRLIAEVAGAPLAGRILEIGCYDGAVALQLAREGANEVVASDLARYYVVQRPGSVSAQDVARQQDALHVLRERARTIADLPPGRVRFVEDDITASALNPETFDAIVSTEVLEHLGRPADAFAAIARLLRPGGVAYHDYNPFFAVNGGHSLCTLDFTWGHARLDSADFERYLQEIRPTELEPALRFYLESLNRMTQADLRTAVADAGLELLVLLPWHDRALLRELAPGVLDQVRRTYPSVTVSDLLATFVTVIVRRPDGGSGAP